MALASPASGQEVAVPDKPVPATVTSYRIVALSQSFEPEPRFTITYVDNTGRIYHDEHAGPTVMPNPSGGEPLTNASGADVFLRQLNTADFSQVSIVKRLLQHLVQHGKIPPSTVAGTPERERAHVIRGITPAGAALAIAYPDSLLEESGVWVLTLTAADTMGDVGGGRVLIAPAPDWWLKKAVRK